MRRKELLLNLGRKYFTAYDLVQCIWWETLKTYLSNEEVTRDADDALLAERGEFGKGINQQQYQQKPKFGAHDALLAETGKIEGKTVRRKINRHLILALTTRR